MNDCCGALQLVPSGDQFSKTRSQSPENQVPAACAGCAGRVVPTGRASPLHGRGEEPQQEGEEMGQGPVPHGRWVLAASGNTSHTSPNTSTHLGGCSSSFSPPLTRREKSKPRRNA